MDLEEQSGEVSDTIKRLEAEIDRQNEMDAANQAPETVYLQFTFELDDSADIEPIVRAATFLQSVAGRSAFANPEIGERLFYACDFLAQAIYGAGPDDRTREGCQGLMERERMKEAKERLPDTMIRLGAALVSFPRIAYMLREDVLSSLPSMPDDPREVAQAILAHPILATQIQGAALALQDLIKYSEGITASVLRLAAEMTGQASRIVIENDPDAIKKIEISKR